jgi:hypothetical protein
VVRGSDLVRKAGFFASALLLSLTGCRAGLVDRNDLIGRYEYHSGNKSQGTTCFVLTSDGSYVLGDAREPLSQTSMSGTPSHGTWQLGSGTGQELFIGRSSLPVRRTPSSIRVTVDDDLGMYCDLPLQRQ